MYCVDGERGGGGRQYSGECPTTSQLRVASRKRCGRKCFGGVGSSITLHPTETPEYQKCSGGSSPGLLIICFPLNICFSLSVLVFGPDGLPSLANFIVQSILSTCVVNIKSSIVNSGIHVAKSIGKI